MDEKIDSLSSFTALRSKVIFIHHVKGSKPMTQVMDIVRRLHGELSEFFDNRVDIVITNQSDGTLPRRSDSSYPEASSPASSRGTNYDYIRSSPLGTTFAPSSSATQASSLSQPSPLNSNSPYSSQSSPFAALSPSGGGSSCGGSQKHPSRTHSLPTSTLSRGQRMTMLARNSGSVDSILEKALRRKICILTVKEFWKWFHNLPSEIQIYCEECLPPNIVEDKKLDQTIGVKVIRPPCVKVNSLSQSERPFYVEATLFEPQLWPAEDFAPTNEGSPSKNSEATASEAPAKKAATKRTAGLMVQKRWKHRLTKAKKKKNGKINICEACHGSYNNLNKHLKSERHCDFAAKADEHFSSVDQVISSLPDVASVITTAKERRTFQNQLKTKNRSSLIETRKSFEKSADSDGAEKDFDHINHGALSTCITNETSSLAATEAQSRNVSLNDREKKSIPDERMVAADNGNNENKNTRMFGLESPSSKSQPNTPSQNGHDKLLKEDTTRNITNDGKIFNSCEQNAQNENGPRFHEGISERNAYQSPSMNEKKNFVHEVDLDLSPIEDCALCQEPVVLQATSPIGCKPTFNRPTSATDSFNPSSWDNVVYRNLESDFFSPLNGFSRSDTQPFELSAPQLSVELLKSDLACMTPVTSVGPFVNNPSCMPVLEKESHFANVTESTPSEFAARRMEPPILSAIVSKTRDGATNATPNNVSEPSFFSSIASKDSQHEQPDATSMLSPLKESNMDDSAFLESPFAVSRPPVRGRFYGTTASPRRRHSTRLFVRMGGRTSPERSEREGTPEMECRFSFCSNCDAFHLKPESLKQSGQVTAKLSETCLSSSPVICSPRQRVRGRLFRSPRHRLTLADDFENCLDSELAAASPEKRNIVSSLRPTESFSTSPLPRKRKRLFSRLDNDSDVKNTLLRRFADQLPSDDAESPNKDIAKSTSTAKNVYTSPSRRRRTKK